MVIVKLPLIALPFRVVLQLDKLKLAPRTFVDPFSRSVPLFTDPEAGMMTCPNSTFPSTLEPDCESVSLSAPVVGVWLLSVLVLVFEKDLGTSLLYFGMFVVTLYIATERSSWLIIGLLLFFGGAFLAYFLGSTVGGPFANFYVRAQIWLDPFEDPTGSGYQLVQAHFGVAERHSEAVVRGGPVERRQAGAREEAKQPRYPDA